MATIAARSRASAGALDASSTYDRFAGACAILAGLSGFVYSLAFVVLRSDLLSALCLLLAGLFGSAAVVGVYQRVRHTDAAFALWAVFLGMAGALGSAVHAAYDLSNALHPPATPNVDLPSQIDPRGLLTFGVAGLGMLIVAWLIVRGGSLPIRLGYLGYLTGALLVVIYLARLVILDATSPLVLVPALVTGFLASPAWYIWLGLSLRRPTP
jgi:uncharacterized membrane protein HdeD (DUF308 family)